MPRTFPACLCLLAMLVFSSSFASAAEILTVAITKDMEQAYTALLDGRRPEQISSFRSPYANRTVVDLILMHKALKIGGMDDIEYDFQIVPNSERERVEVKSGRAVLGSQDYWSYDFDDSVYKTDPIISEGSFEKGLYTTHSNKALLGLKSPEEIKRFSAAIIGTWRGDVKVLNSLKVKELHTVYELETVSRFLSLSRADFTLYEFPSGPDLAVNLFGVELVPVPGIKVILPGVRCFMVSKKHPLGKRVFEALSIGIKALKMDGTITRAFTECGFTQERVKDWRVINR